MVETKRPETPGTMASQSWVQKLSISSLTSNKKIKHIKAFHSEASSEFKKVVRVVKLHTLLRYSGKKKKKPLHLSLHLGNLLKSGFHHTFCKPSTTKEKFLRIWTYLCVVKIWQIKFSGWLFLNTPVIQILPPGQGGYIQKTAGVLGLSLKSACLWTWG